ncbi:hypothetical protein PUR71_16440 [Streptomyces sp. SP17BM10]|uniref:hypothetical protein n=1 Tax=Streptomyces sp. SP17BM10 TaxID=3002530 RepID=UPI002E75AC67|nr:hypothetical protein [Streptomyces sp. SP17BM10]MEE1784478.1 hypothetical protein [Streptomyces sp. SP17BM10]
MNGRQGPVVRSGVVDVALCAAAARSSGTGQAHDGVQDLATGTGFGTGNQRITGASTTFSVGQTAYVAFITDAGAAGWTTGTLRADACGGDTGGSETKTFVLREASTWCSWFVGPGSFTDGNRSPCELVPGQGPQNVN